MALFLETSAIVKLVRPEAGSDVMDEIVRRPADWGGAFVSEYMALEVNCRIAAFRRRGVFNRKDYRRAQRIVESHMRHTFIVQPARPDDVSRAVELAARYARWDIGSLDFLHIAAAKALAVAVDPDPVTVVAADGSLMQLAERLGFAVFHPERDDISGLGPLRLPL